MGKLKPMLIYLWLLVIITLILIYLYLYPFQLLMPYNILLDYIVSSQSLYISRSDKQLVFPSFTVFEESWLDIRAEALAVLDITQGNVWRQFAAYSEDFWSGWDVFPLRLYGQDIAINLKQCPTMARLLQQCPAVHSAVFSVLQPGKTIPPHVGPFKGVLRYHLGLVIPLPSSFYYTRQGSRLKVDHSLTGSCYLNVDGQIIEWVEGQGFLFDETYLHSASNHTDQVRIILYLDIPRQLDGWMADINELLLWMISQSPANQRAIVKVKRDMIHLD